MPISYLIYRTIDNFTNVQYLQLVIRSQHAGMPAPAQHDFLPEPSQNRAGTGPMTVSLRLAGIQPVLGRCWLATK